MPSVVDGLPKYFDGYFGQSPDSKEDFIVLKKPMNITKLLQVSK